MPPIVKLTDKNELVLTKEYPWCNWEYEEFNPIQSRIFEYYDKPMNGLIAARTSAGKTTICEMYIGHCINVLKKKALFLVPMRSLASEKYDEWMEDKFKDHKVCICTGDSRLDGKKTEELEASDIIIMTSEMLSSRSRSYKAEKNEFFKQVGVIIVDEVHTIGSSRGPHLEVGLMKFTEINKTANIVMLSATLPNCQEIAEWVSYALNNKETYLLMSDYRPTKLTIHYEKYFDGLNSYYQVEKEKINKALDIVEHYDKDKFLVFVHGKDTGKDMTKALIEAGIPAAFHSADVEKNERRKIEQSFRHDPNFRVVVATPTLSTGCNLPARRVIVLGVHRGMEEVDSNSVIQACGRAGRKGLDPQGDAYILCPENKFDYHVSRLRKPEKIKSQMLSQFGDHHKVLAFHLVSEINQGDVTDDDEARNWYERSLAHFQSYELDDVVLSKTLDSLRRCGAIRQEDGKWKTTPVGKVASLFYFSPFDVADLKKNFTELFDQKKESDDTWIAFMLGNLDSRRMNIVSKSEKNEFLKFSDKIRNTFSTKFFFNDASIKTAFCYYNLLNGVANPKLANFQATLKADYNRMSQVMQAFDSMSGAWGKTKWLKILEQRIQHGVPAQLVDLCRISGVSKARAKKLFDMNVKTYDEFKKEDPSRLSKILNLKVNIIEKMIAES